MESGIRGERERINAYMSSFVFIVIDHSTSEGHS